CMELGHSCPILFVFDTYSVEREDNIGTLFIIHSEPGHRCSKPRFNLLFMLKQEIKRLFVPFFFEVFQTQLYLRHIVICHAGKRESSNSKETVDPVFFGCRTTREAPMSCTIVIDLLNIGQSKCPIFSPQLCAGPCFLEIVR